MNNYFLSNAESLQNNNLFNFLTENGYKKLEDFKSSVNNISIGYFINKIDKCFYLIDKPNFIKILKTLKENEKEIVKISDFLSDLTYFNNKISNCRMV